MRRWAALTALLTISLGISFLLHERPPTGGHALAGLSILGLSVFLLGGIAALGVQRTRGNAITLLVLQIAGSLAAIISLAVQQLPWTLARGLVMLLFIIPVLGSLRHFRPTTWAPKPLSDRDLITDLVVEVVLVLGAVALMIWAWRFPISFIAFVVSGSLNVWRLALLLRIRRSLARFSDLPQAS